MDDLQIWTAQRAKDLRKTQTPHEEKMWRYLRAKRFSGFKFKRQEPIARYIVDFVCYEAKLIIELDGSQHVENKSHDENRDCWLQEQGFRVLRFWNNQLTKQTKEVMDEIWSALQSKTPSPQPSPIKGEGADLSSEGTGG
ncbi:MAG: endonuclease domain-containing protein [Cellvibrio sp.]|nr:endonuclease domain-containing protein [Cellvibrio sp.]